MGIFSPSDQTRFFNQGEDDFNSEYPSILDRISLDIVAGTDLYVLPDRILSIRRVTWLGWKINALNQRVLRETNLTGQETGASRPFNYIFNNVGQLTIKFFPTPADNISSITTDLWGSEIPNRVIIEFWSAADHASLIVPSFFRNQLLNAYMFSKLYAIEGKGQDLKASVYFTKKYTALKERYSDLLQFFSLCQGRVVNGVKSEDRRFLTPHLSIAKFGIGVNLGE